MRSGAHKNGSLFSPPGQRLSRWAITVSPWFGRACASFRNRSGRAGGGAEFSRRRNVWPADPAPRTPPPPPRGLVRHHDAGAACGEGIGRGQGGGRDAAAVPCALARCRLGGRGAPGCKIVTAGKFGLSASALSGKALRAMGISLPPRSPRLGIPERKQDLSWSGGAGLDCGFPPNFQSNGSSERASLPT